MKGAKTHTVVQSTVTPVSPIAGTELTYPDVLGLQFLVGLGLVMAPKVATLESIRSTYAYTKTMPEFARLRLWRSLSLYHHKRRPSKLLSDCVVFQIQNDSTHPGRPIFTSKEDGYEAISVYEICEETIHTNMLDIPPKDIV